MTAYHRRVLLGIALLASLAATRWVAGEDAPAQENQRKSVVEAKREAVAAAPRLSAPATAAPAPPEALAIEKLQRPRANVNGGNLFGSDTWEAPAPKNPARPPPPPPPTAPPLPYAYFGKMSDEGRTTVFLSTAERSHAVRVGDVLDGRYRIEDINERTLVVTYLPLQQQQTLNIGN